ncbi:YqeG family HAD IIIA-type phosphatase [Allofustis seminis]|uniref:YqeG family HAD IIIA-type phosphatase n=1 Tax=Allofustis seminis TaxID=166939 RepID=UPI00036BF214|nr:YqeG family HAD IIIA-type phosphatase [Allofustis seminis]
MLKVFKPTWMVKSIYHISPQELIANGVKIVLTDLDNTLIAWNHPDATEQSLQWIQKVVASGIDVVIISNNCTHRVKKVADMLHVPFISWAMKPFSRGFKKLQKRYNVKKSDVLMIGDQVFTDVVGSNLYGIDCVLVQPIEASDAWNTKINRYLEMKIISKLTKEDPRIEWRDSLDQRIR